MEQLLMNTPDFRRLYNCSIYDVDSIHLEQRQHVALGIVFVLIGVIEEVTL
jgi:hypothetical protein